MVGSGRLVEETVLTSFEEFDVIGGRWVGDDRLVFTLGQLNSPTGPGQFNGGGLFMVSRAGRESRRIAPTVHDVARKTLTAFMSGTGSRRTRP